MTKKQKDELLARAASVVAGTLWNKIMGDIKAEREGGHRKVRDVQVEVVETRALKGASR